MKTNHEKVYDSLRPLLTGINLLEQVRHMGLVADKNGHVPVVFSQRAYVITPTAVLADIEDDISYTHRSVLIHYITSEGRGEPEHTFVSLAQLSGVPRGQQRHDQIMTNPLAREIGNDYPLFAAVAESLGGTDMGISLSSGRSWQFQVLPKIPLQLIFFRRRRGFWGRYSNCIRSRFHIFYRLRNVGGVIHVFNPGAYPKGSSFNRSNNMKEAFEKGEIINFKTKVDYAIGGVVSKQVLKNDAGNITLFSFDKGQGLSEHIAPFDAMVQVIEGTAEIKINGKPFQLKEGMSIIMPANISHALFAAEPFKMILTMIKG